MYENEKLDMFVVGNAGRTEAMRRLEVPVRSPSRRSYPKRLCPVSHGSITSVRILPNWVEFHVVTSSAVAPALAHLPPVLPCCGTPAGSPVKQPLHSRRRALCYPGVSLTDLLPQNPAAELSCSFVSMASTEEHLGPTVFGQSEVTGPSPGLLSRDVLSPLTLCPPKLRRTEKWGIKLHWK